MAAPVVHFEILGKDRQKLQSFYRELFEWNIDANNPMNYGMVAPGGEGSIAGGIGTAQEGPGHVTVYVQVADLQASLDKAEKLGGKTIMPPMEIPGYVTLAMFADPEGHVIGLVKG